MKKAILFILTLAGLGLKGVAQVPEYSADTGMGTARQIETLNTGDISVRSVKLVNQTRKSIRGLYKAGLLDKIKARNQLILAKIDTGRLRSMDLNDPHTTIMFLENRKIFLTQEQGVILKEEAKLREILQTLDGLISMLNHEQMVWKKTSQKLKKDSVVSPVPSKLASTIMFIDSSRSILERKSDSLLEILEKTIAVGIKIDIALEKTVALIEKKEMNSFARDQVPFFYIDFRKGNTAQINAALQNFNRLKLKELSDYLRANWGSTIILSLLFIALLLLFGRLKRRPDPGFKGHGMQYREMLLTLAARPFSSAVLLCTLAVILIYHGRPMIFRELVMYISVFPVIVLLNRLLQMKYRGFLISYGIVLLLYLFLIVVASDMMLYRIMFFIISVIQSVILILLIIKIKKTVQGRLSKNLAYLLILLNLLLSFSSLAANISGRVTLASLAMNGTFINVYSGLTLFVAVTLLNGLAVMAIDSGIAGTMNIVRLYGEVIKQWTILILNSLAILYWIITFLRSFHVDDNVWVFVQSIFTTKISIGTASFSLDMILLFFTVIFLSYFLARFLQIILEKDVLIRLPLPQGLPHSISTGLQYALIISGFFLAFYATGFPMDKMTIIIGAFSVGIGFGLQKIFSNMVSGLILLFERPIKLGDTVQVGQVIGTVKSIDLRASNIHTFDGSEVIVPNEHLISNEVTNWTLSDMKRRLKVPLSVCVDSDPREVNHIVMKVLLGNPMILQRPEPGVFFIGVGPSSLDFELLFWISDRGEGRRIKSEVMYEVFSELQKNKIRVPIPKREINFINPPTTDSL